MSSIFLKFCQKMVHSICDSYSKFGATAPRQTGVITRRKKWGRLTPPSKSRNMTSLTFDDSVVPWPNFKSSCAKWMTESKSAPQITLEGSRTRKNRQRSMTKFDLSWPRLTCVGPDDMWNACVILHVHIHITSKNGNVCKLCATGRIFRLTWPQLWRHRSNVRGVRVLQFSAARKYDGQKAIIKMVTFDR